MPHAPHSSRGESLRLGIIPRLYSKRRLLAQRPLKPPAVSLPQRRERNIYLFSAHAYCQRVTTHAANIAAGQLRARAETPESFRHAGIHTNHDPGRRFTEEGDVTPCEIQAGK